MIELGLGFAIIGVLNHEWRPVFCGLAMVMLSINLVLTALH